MPPVCSNHTIQFNSIRFDSIRFDSIRFNSIRFDSIRFHYLDEQVEFVRRREEPRERRARHVGRRGDATAARAHFGVERRAALARRRLERAQQRVDVRRREVVLPSGGRERDTTVRLSGRSRQPLRDASSLYSSLNRRKRCNIPLSGRSRRYPEPREAPKVTPLSPPSP